MSHSSKAMMPILRASTLLRVSPDFLSDPSPGHTEAQPYQDQAILPSSRGKLRLWARGGKSQVSGWEWVPSGAAGFFSVCLLPAPYLHPASSFYGLLSRGFCALPSIFRYYHFAPSFFSAQTLLLLSGSPSFHFWMILMSVVSPPSGFLAAPLPWSQPPFSHFPDPWVAGGRVTFQAWGSGAEHQDHGSRKLAGRGGGLL